MSLGITGKLVLAFVTLLLGVVLIGVIATNSLVVTDRKVIGDENEIVTADDDNVSRINTTEVHTVTNFPTTWKTADCPLASITIKQVDGDELADSTDYTFDSSAGSWVFISTVDSDALLNGSSNLSTVSYSYCGDDYLNIGWGRNILNLVSGFFALAVLGASIGLFYSIAKDTGML